MPPVTFGELIDPGAPTRSVRWRATGRAGGVSAHPYRGMNLALHVGDEPDDVTANRRLAADLMGVGPSAMSWMRSTHGAEVAVVSAGGEVPGVDGLVTTTPGVCLVALAADCVPLALVDVKAGVIAAVHCGWQGIGAGIVASTVARMGALGATGITAVVGPHVCGDCYPVPEQRVASLAAAVDEVTAAAACHVRDGTWFIDVGAGVRSQLTSLGISVSSVGGCTVESESWFSHRRDGITGRHGMLVAIADGQAQ